MGYDDLEGADPGMRPYFEAKRDADAAVRASGLDWTIVKPGRLTNEPGTGRIDAARKLGRSGEIPRDDVALTILECLQAPNTIRKEFEELSGDVPVGEAVAARALSPSAARRRARASRAAAAAGDRLGSSPSSESPKNPSAPPRRRVTASAKASAPPPPSRWIAVSSGHSTPTSCAVTPGASSSPHAKPWTSCSGPNSCSPASWQCTVAPKRSR